jgi:hypothetical protein
VTHIGGSCLVERYLQEGAPLGIALGATPDLIGTYAEGLDRTGKQLAPSQAFNQFGADDGWKPLLRLAALILADIRAGRSGAGSRRGITSQHGTISRFNSGCRSERLGDS